MNLEAVSDQSRKLAEFLLVLAGSATAALLAMSYGPVEKFSLVAGVAVGLLAALVLAVIAYLSRAASSRAAAEALARDKLGETAIHPLVDCDVDTIVTMENLRLPTRQFHSRKHFKRCRFEGPGGIVLVGGTYEHCRFAEGTRFVPVEPGRLMSRFGVLQDCRVEHCEFHRVTIFCSQALADALSPAAHRPEP